MVREVADSDFEAQVIEREGPVLVDFWAEWCAPCRAIAPSVNAVAREFESTATVVKVNVDENRIVSQRLGIRGIPTLILFKDGVEQERLVGAVSQEKMTKLVEKYI